MVELRAHDVGHEGADKAEDGQLDHLSDAEGNGDGPSKGALRGD